MLSDESVRNFVTSFINDIVSKCPNDIEIHYVYMIRWSCEGDALQYVYADLPYSSIEVISNSDLLHAREEVINGVLHNIFEHMANDPNQIDILDFDSMYMLYRYVNKKSVLSARIPYNHPYRGGNNFSKRYYSTATPLPDGPPKKNHWIVYNDPAEFMGLNRDRIKIFLENFFQDIISPCDPGQFFYLIFKVRFVANTEEDYNLEDWRWEDDGLVRDNYITRSFSRVQRLEHNPDLQKEKIKKLLSVIMFHVNNNSENYDDLFIHNFFIMYKLIDPIYSPDGLIINKPTPIKSENPLTRSDINKLELLDFESKGILPTMDIESWSDNMKFSNDIPSSFIRDELFYTFDISYSYYICEVVDSEDKLIYKFKDSLIKNTSAQTNLGTFKREILKNNQEGEEIVVKTFQYVDGKMKIWMEPGKSLFITNPNFKPNNVTDIGKRKYSTRATPEAVSHKMLNTSNLEMSIMLNSEFNILTLDLETRKLSNNELEVISNCIYDGKHYKTFYLTDYDMDQYLLLEASIDYMLKPKYNNYYIYIHNLSHFDGIFLLKNIVELKKIGYEIKLLYKDDKMISIEIKRSASVSKELGFEDESFSITLYDSYLILPTSLNKVAKSFGFNIKMEFDIHQNDNADLSDNNFRDRLLEYNKYDCYLLFKIMKRFRISIKNVPTLPSLAFKIYRTHFMKEKSIAITWLEEYREISQGYRGGAVDVYRPSGENLFYYDVNSLYPYVMKEFIFPVGAPNYFEGFRDLGSIFGIVYCSITTPKNMNTPVLLIKNDQTNGKTMAPLGSWEGWYVTEELKYAKSCGYQVEVLKGYHWGTKADIFSGYVDTLYQNRLKYAKSDSKNFISKLLMNSLYGKFGMSPIQSVHQLLTEEDMTVDYLLNSLQESSESALNVDLTVLEDQGLHIISKEVPNNSIDITNENSENRIFTKLLNISTPIAMFITAYARIHMAKFKVKYQNNLYYSDTDSLVLNTELPREVISNSLGDFKLEHIIKKGIFIAPKVYALVLEDGSEEIKIKGSKVKISYSEMEALLHKDALKIITQEKWLKNIEGQHIKIVETLYSLRVTDNKRNLIYKDGILIDTKPITI
jgi:DNA polymerase type B, organellar and viral